MSQPEKQASTWPADYQIRVQGILDPHWSAVFDGLTITHDANGETVIAGQVVDQPALYGLLSRVRDLGLTLLIVARSELTPADSSTPSGPDVHTR
jgi:hypothetical protein